MALRAITARAATRAPHKPTLPLPSRYCPHRCCIAPSSERAWRRMERLAPMPSTGSASTYTASRALALPPSAERAVALQPAPGRGTDDPPSSLRAYRVAMRSHPVVLWRAIARLQVPDVVSQGTAGHPQALPPIVWKFNDVERKSRAGAERSGKSCLSRGGLRASRRWVHRAWRA